MAYSKQTWDTTSIFNPTRMNHIEDGIEGVDTKTADDIPYSSGVSVKDKIDDVDGKTADDIPYSTGVSVKDKIDGLVTLVTQTFTATTTSSGAVLVPSVAQGKIVACRYIGRTGLVFDRGDSYLTCKDNDLNPVSNASVTVQIYYATE